MTLTGLRTCSTCSKSFREEPNWAGQCPSCSQLCLLLPYGWTMIDSSVRKQRPANVHPREWVRDERNGLIKVEDGCWNWQPGQHHAPQASPALFDSPLAPEMHWAVAGRSGRQVPAYYIFLNAPPASLKQPEADHLCCNRRCVNPDHIEWTSKDENTRRNHIRERYSRLWQKLGQEAKPEPP